MADLREYLQDILGEAEAAAGSHLVRRGEALQEIIELATAALTASPAGDDPDASPAAARSSSTEAVEQEVERLRAVEAAAQAVLADWTERLMDREEKFVGGEYGSYWSPHSSMVASEKMAGLRAALAPFFPGKE